MNRSVFWTLLLIVAIVSGCKKAAPDTAQSAAPIAAETQSTAEATAGSPPVHGPGLTSLSPSTQVVIPDNADTGAALSRLSVELRKYVLRTRTAPKTFEEFVAVAHVQAPAPPPGKKYEIKSGAVVLAAR